MNDAVAVAQLGARMHYAVPRIFMREGRLQRLFTDISVVNGWPRHLAKIPVAWRPPQLRRLMARQPHDIPAERITSFTWFGLEYAARRAVARTERAMTAVYLWAGERFTSLILSEGIDDRIAAFYAFNSAALEVFLRLRGTRVRRILEQTIAPYRFTRDILLGEAERFPEWEFGLVDDPYSDDYSRREQEEWGESELIICASDFVRDTIARLGGPSERCVVVPYGIEMPATLSPSRSHDEKRLRVLSVGTVSLRKGTPYLLEAASKLHDKLTVRIIGPIHCPQSVLSRAPENVTFTGPVPRSEIRRHYEWADLFVLPSLSEGSATVTYEALAFGLPVICTPNTGSVVRDGLDGFIVPIRSAEAIVEKLLHLCNDSSHISELSKNAKAHSQSFDLDAYAQRLTQIC